MEGRMKLPACNSCMHWKRMSGARGNCWSSSRETVPQPTRETDACDQWRDQLANRDVVQGWVRE